MNKLSIRKRLAARALARKVNSKPSAPTISRRVAKATGDDEAMSDATREKVINRLMRQSASFSDSMVKAKACADALDKLAQAIANADVAGAKAAQSAFSEAWEDFWKNKPDMMDNNSVANWRLDNVRRPEGAGKAAGGSGGAAQARLRKAAKSVADLRRKITLEPDVRVRKRYEEQLAELEELQKRA